MSSKTAASWSMGRRMAVWYAASAAALLLVATTTLYLGVASSLEAEGDEGLEYAAASLEKSGIGPGGRPAHDDWPGDGYRVRDAAGGVIASSPEADERLPPGLVAGAGGVDHRTAAGRWMRAVSREIGGRTYEVCYDRTREMELLRRYRRWMALILAPAVLASSVLGALVARKGLRPVAEIAATAARIGPDRLGERIAADRLPAELSDLAATFNVMLDRLQESFRRLERFSADIAHELRTPVHALRNVAEVALTTSQTRADDQEALAVCLESAGGLARLIDRLLFIARAGSPRAVLDLEAVDLTAELESVREFYEPAASQAGIELVRLPSPPLPCRVDRTLMQQAVGNLLTNAFAHTPRGGRVSVAAAVEGADVVICVSDTGSGIAPEHLPRIFDRFYRPDPARPSGAGCGLGLAIVKSFAELHGGRAEIASRPGQGTQVTLRLPVAGPGRIGPAAPSPDR
ncbi:heavy metal sensor histidine kinase [Gemmata sp. JC717]|uniref:heavy metal sensor histidine kinase n=1 Tax=Gemmata algarum TaxID=2975278 RepID=UPI0021BA7059|nr:heavy metal sensor histidine kinase [Gemmata algarum]MDY3553450.1 heavy metal sensor histidine kinase [Gemmata algarum]